MKRIIIFLLIIIMSGFTVANADENIITVLLLGTDEFIGTVTGEEELSRADAILILTIHRDTGAIRLLSVERDYLITLPGDIGQNKLCTATYFGGPNMCMQAVNELFDLDIDLYAQVDVSAAEDLIDAIGGIEVEIFESELGIIRYVSSWKRVFSTAGIHILNGAQAVATMRSRDIEIAADASDKNRNERQQRVLAACIKKLDILKPGKILPLLSTLLPLIKSNITMADLTGMAQSILMSIETALEQARTPSGSYIRKIVNMHSVVLANNMDEEIATVHAFLFGTHNRELP